MRAWGTQGAELVLGRPFFQRRLKAYAIRLSRTTATLRETRHRVRRLAFDLNHRGAGAVFDEAVERVRRRQFVSEWTKADRLERLPVDTTPP